MSAAIRFLALAVVGWAGVRAATLGLIPGADMFTIGRSAAAVPPIAPTPFAAIEPVSPAAWPQQPGAEVYRYPVAVPVAVPYYYRLPVGVPQASAAVMAAPSQSIAYAEPMAGPLFDVPVRPLDDWPLADIARSPWAAGSSTPVPSPSESMPGLPRRLDRIQLSAWALLRNEPGPQALAAGGMLGGSQAGARLTYNFNHWLAASVRTSSPVNQASGGEVAGGVRITPLRSLPVAITLERRQAMSDFGGRSAFAALIEGGLYQRPVGWGFDLDGYAQAGVVGINSRDLFADGGFTLTRPVFANFSAGLGLWGGVQPDLYRLDAGPRLTMRLRNGMRAHLDWRQRLTGNAAPGSGPAVTLAADF